MKLHARISTVALAAALIVPSAASHAQPLSTATVGHLDFRNAQQTSKKVASAPVGPYVAGFSPASMVAAYSASPFNVFCIDWLGAAGDSKVRVLTFNETMTSSDLVAAAVRNKYVASGPGTGLTALKLKQAAWLTTQFNTSQSNWISVHHAIWGLLWDVGATGGAGKLPGLGSGAGSAQDWINQSLLAAPSFDASGYRLLASINANDTFNNSRQIFLARSTLDPAVVNSVVPEPGTYALLATGLLGLGIASRRRAAKRRQTN